MKKGKKIICILLPICLVVALLVGGAILLLNKQEEPAVTIEVTGDVDWYDENEKEFVLTTMEELYGFAQLSKSHDFKGQTIKLGADIVVNEGDAKEWAKKAPSYLWNPITGFAGKFDGQGHTISGIYGNSIVTSLGLFTDTQKTCVIKNLNLVNSCFKNNNDIGTGSIIGVGGGKLQNIYSDAVITSSGKYVGGLIGRVTTKGENQITNCWFAGSITMKGTECSDVGGIVGAYTVEDAINVIEHSHSTATIDCMGYRVGGICGNVGNGSFLNLNDSMYTGTLVYDYNKYDVVGSVIGQIMGSSSAIINDTYTVDEIANRTIGTTDGYQKGSAIAVGKTYLSGMGGYQWTTLDFDKHWVVSNNDMPRLSYYTDAAPSVVGVEKMVDISWYDQAGATFELTTPQQLYGFAYLSRSYDFRGQTIKLGADITINEGDAKTWGKTAPEYNWTPIAWYGNSLSKRFKGTFDGQGHTISGIYAKGTENIDCVGLFGEIYHGAVVKDFKIVNSYFEGVLSSDVRGPVGSVAGRLRGTIENVYSDAIIVNSAKNTGGIVGMITGDGQNRIANCWFDGTLTAITRSGGILGGVYGNKGNIEATIEHCLNTGDINVQIGQGGVGGICGTAETWSILYINDCLNAGTYQTIGEGKESTHIGSLLGTVTETGGVGSTAVISNSYGVKEFYSRLIGWKYADEGAVQSSVVFTNTEELTGYGGYQWTTLDFDNNWAVQMDGVPVPVAFVESRPSLSDVVRMVDYSWFDANKDVYTITTFQQLYAVARLWDITNQFKGKTVLLGADIVVNEGKATEWQEAAPAFEWTPMRFSGTFDGQGHTISGIYVKGGEEDNYVGFFHRIYNGGTAKNFKLVNSYFEGTMSSGKRGAVGSIAGRNNGIIDSVYSDAIVVNSARMTGGLVGMITGEGDNKILNSWFDGKVTGINRTGGILGGIYGNKENIEATIANTLNTGKVAVKVGSGDVGGICGIAETWSTLYINDCLNAGTFETVGTDKEPNTHIGTIFGSVTMTDDVGSRVVMKNVYGVDAFYSKLVGWSYEAEGVSESQVLLMRLDTLTGSNGYQYTSLDFKNSWALNENGIPVPIAFGTVTPEIPEEENGQVDYDWYDPDKDMYIISTAEQLLAFGALCNKDNDYFKGKTIQLGADIVLNEGDAQNWSEKVPENTWIPVNFKGIFDGQGHTISGVYAKTDDTYTGFFTTISSGAVVKNLKLVNSYFEGTKTSGRNGVGSIAGRNLGTIDTVYSDAIVKNAYGALMTGGIAGMSTGDTENTIVHCQFAGEIYAGGSTGGILGGAYAANAVIEHCLSTGAFHINDGSSAIGGLCGYVQSTSNVVIADSMSAGKLLTEGTVKQVGAIVGSLHNDANLEVANVYGNKEFSENRIGYHSSGVLNKVAGTTFAVWDLDALKGYGAYQSTTLDFEDEKHWVLRDGEIPGLNVFDDTNLDLTYAKTLANYSWYDADSDTYIISTPQQLYGFNLICNEDNEFFKGKTVKLGADISLNEGEAKDWGETAPANVWTPVSFSGTFDGAGYTISGAYVKTDNTYNGFFHTINSGAVVKNVSLVNSYIEGIQTEGRCGTGSIAGRNLGTIDTVYSNAIVKNANGALMTGGIAGISTGNTENTITNCWFDGEIYAGGNTGGILGGTYKATAVITHCQHTGVININAGSTAVGGLLGFVQSTSDVVLSDSFSAGNLVQVGDGTIKQLGAVVGALHNDGVLKVENAYGNSAFAEKKIGYLASGTLTQVSGSGFAIRNMADVNGYGAYQWMGLDFANDKYWVLRNEEIPMLKAFSVLNLDLDYAKTLADYRWFDSELDEYTISTEKELYGWNELCSDENSYLAGKTVKLGADITLNEGNASDWAENAPEKEWIPFTFGGTFDGAGHTISGVYVKTDNTYNGFFHTINSGAVVKNVKLVNSYIEGIQTEGRCGTGSIAGRNLGTIEAVYSNAIVKNANGALMTGGIAGISTGNTENTITNCWFDGEIYAGGNTGGILGGTYKATAVIAHCQHTGVININAGSTAVGGLLGFVQSTSDVVLSDSFSAGNLVQVGDGTIKQLGAVVGALHNDGVLKVENAYGNSAFAEKKIGYLASGTLTQPAGSGFALRNMDDVKGYGAYQWMKLDFDAEKHWVLKDGAYPALNAFDDTNLDLEHAKTLSDYNWYDMERDEYVISTVKELYGFNELCTEANEYFAGKTIKLGADITLNEGVAADWATEAPDNTWAPVDFSGTFDGQGHTLSGVYAKTTGTYTGFFKIMNVGSVVKNLRLENSYFEGTRTSNDRRGTGSIAGQNGGTIDTVYSNAIVKNEGAKMTGGIAGMSSLAGENTIRNCWFDGQIYGSHDTGGILGGTYKATANIEHCLNTGVLYIKAGKVDIGGLCGYIQNASAVAIIDSLNAGTLVSTGDGTVSEYIGTIVGKLDTPATLTVKDTHGISEFSTKTIGLNNGTATLSANIVKASDAIKGYDAAQYTALDFYGKEYWVLKDGALPLLNAFADTDLDLEHAKTLPNYSWYEADLDVYEISTAQQLMVFNELCNADDTDYFNGKIIKLCADITYNSGNAEDWAEEAPTNKWTPLTFKGTLDGQGHTISGIYAKSGSHTGLFNTINSGATVRNLKLLNSYFECTKTGTGRTGAGSIAGQHKGTIDTVYSDAIVVKNTALMTGGIAGMVIDAENALITNCWFDGILDVSGTSCGGILGGIYGYEMNTKATIEHCLNSGEIRTVAGTKRLHGGICGYVHTKSSLSLSDSLNAGSYVIKNSGTVTQVGTIVGGLNNNTGTQTLSNVYGVTEFKDTCVGYTKADATVVGEENQDYFKASKDTYFGKGASGLSFYADGQSSANDGDTKTCWWSAREGKLPMLESFLSFASELGK